MDTPRWCLGTMYFGTTVDRERSYELLDRYLGAGGEWLDTANNYAFWVDGATGDESELVLAGWLRSRRHDVVLATKVGARPRPGSRSLANVEGLSAKAVRVYAHIDDAETPLPETLGAFQGLMAEGLVGAVACSNHTVARLRDAHAVGLARYEAVQQRATYLTSRPDAGFAPQVEVDDDLLAYAAAEGLPVFGYAALLAGGYSGRPVPDAYRHRRTDAQLQAVRDTAVRLGVTPNQVVLGWLASRGIVPVLGVSSVGQLDEAMAADRLDAHGLAALAAARGD
jgi:aryl-alcohol dehydrogenase-like predicted oxidoreductase